MSKDPDNRQRPKLVSEALRAVRSIRKVSTQELADALGLSVRGYQHFEAGGGRLNIDHIMRFSQAMDCDAMGVLAAVQIGKPEFAAYVAQNKAMTAFMITLEEFVEDTGRSIARLETTTWVSAYREMFRGLSEKAKASEAINSAWLAANAARLGLAAPAPAPSPKPSQHQEGGDEADPTTPPDAGS